MNTIVAFLFFKNRYQSQAFVVFYIESLFYRLQGAAYEKIIDNDACRASIYAPVMLLEFRGRSNR